MQRLDAVPEGRKKSIASSIWMGLVDGPSHPL